MKKYDVIIPLGQACATAMALKEIGVRKTSYPFDWLVTDSEKAGTCGFIGKIKMICNDFKDAFQLKDLTEFWHDNKKHRAVFNKKTGIFYLHDFDWEKSVAEQFPEYVEKYERRIKRFYDDINKNSKILFIFVVRQHNFLSLQEIDDGLKLLNKKFPGKDIDLLIVQDSYDCEQWEFKHFMDKPHIYYYLYRDKDTDGLGNQPVLQRIFNQFINGIDEYDFTTDNIKSYGLSVKEDWGRWSDGDVVYLGVPVEFLGGEKNTVHFDVWPYIVKQHKHQDIDIYIDNEKIASWHFEFGKDMPTTIINIPEHKIKNSSVLLQFKIKKPVSLKELNLGEDTRKIAIGFRKMKITKQC